MTLLRNAALTLVLIPASLAANFAYATSPEPDKIVITSAKIASPPGGPIPVGSPGNWVTTSDYPSAALRIEAQGTSRFRVEVDAQGNVSDCAITGSSGNAELDDKTCELVRQRAKFKPAQDAQGWPTKGSYANAVRWTIPHDLRPPMDSRVERAFDVLPDGSMANCVIVSVSGVAATAYQPGTTACPASVQFAVPKDSVGKRHSKHVIQIVETKVSDAD